MSAHTPQSLGANSDPLAIKRTAAAQIVAHERSSSTQRTIIFTFCSCRHSVAQCSQATKQSLQASMQL
jgi:hypothetical protein